MRTFDGDTNLKAELMAVTQQDAVCTTERALDRIAVTEPYFGLRDVEEHGPGLVTATVPHQEPSDGEYGAVSAAQAARHMAILGSCAAALNRDDNARHHYLAVKAHYLRCAGAPDVVAEDWLRAKAVATWTDRRSARAFVTLATRAGRALTMLDVTFAVMSPRMFARFNPPVSPGAAEHLVTPIDSRWRPLETGTVTAVGAGVRVDCGPVPPAACRGHFPDFPAAPVAVLMGELCRTAAHALALELGTDVPYCIDEGRVSANRLAAAGQDLVLEASYVRRDGEKHVLVGKAAANGESVGEVEVLMSASPPDVDQSLHRC